ncbi:thioredoxin-like protein [Entophlyctis helioformis]|nr:thioredoxin-like protein [Entophlyctis helioformis]
MAKLTLYYDTVSPYSWLAFELLLRYKPIWGIDMEFVPFFLGGVMAASKNTPPGTNPYKARYMARDLVRNGKLFNVPIKGMPKAFPTNSMKAQRLLTHLATASPAQLVPASRALWQCYWGDGQPLSDDALLVSYLSPILGPDTAAMIAAANADEDVKNRLKSATDDAVTKYGAFGAPWIVLDMGTGGHPQTFFGSDRMEQIALLLGKPYHGPNPAAAKL